LPLDTKGLIYVTGGSVTRPDHRTSNFRCRRISSCHRNRWRA